MKIKMRYLWKKNWYFIDFQEDNLALKFKEFEIRNKTTRLELWTGLLDSKEKEIYEGDIVKVCDRETNEGIFEVYFSERYSAFEFVGANSLGWYELRRMTTFEVIGNIYENPELLNQDVNVENNEVEK